MASETNNNSPERVVHSSQIHESAHLHVSGEATYVDDITELAGTLHAALGLSSIAHGEIELLNLNAVKNYPGVVAVFTADDIPGVNDCGPIIHDDPLLAKQVVKYIGQAIFMVVADDREIARRACKLAEISYRHLPAIMQVEDALAQGELLVPPVKLQRGDAEKAITKSPQQLSGSMSCGGQEHFYLEGQISYALPKEDGCILLHCSSQHPSEMQHVVAHVLDIPAHKVLVEMRRMGGGFGGKESQSALFCGLAALAAYRLKRPVKLRPDRDDDFLISGKRHDFKFNYHVGFNADGVINGVKVEMLARGGFSADLSAPVITRAVCHFDNAYYLPEVDICAYALRTNTQSNTAFRGFGGPQGAFAIEYILDDIACKLQLDPLLVRQRNFYGTDTNNITPYQQTVEDNVIVPLVNQLVASSNYQQRYQEIRQFNAASTIIKKGLAITPVKFGISFNVAHFNQAGALVHVYVDGSVLVNHGGTEMGQGLNTKVAQVVADVLGVNYPAVRATATDTSKIANTSATAASTGSDLNGKAAEQAAQRIRQRLIDFLSKKHQVDSQSISFAAGMVKVGEQILPFAEVCQMAYEARVQLWADGFYSTPLIHWDRNLVRGSPFYYFAYGAAVSEVMVDTLTGEWKLLAADILHDAGKSINPAIDIGQIEGGYIQGMGWLTLEELCWNENGKLTTHSPSTYKIPAIKDCPAHFKTELFANINQQETILRSKAVGEPPLLLAFSVFFAIRQAISSIADYQVSPQLNAPTTPEGILNAINQL